MSTTFEGQARAKRKSPTLTIPPASHIMSVGLSPKETQVLYYHHIALFSLSLTAMRLQSFCNASTMQG